MKKIILVVALLIGLASYANVNYSVELIGDNLQKSEINKTDVVSVVLDSLSRAANLDNWDIPIAPDIGNLNAQLGNGAMQGAQGTTLQLSSEVSLNVYKGNLNSWNNEINSSNINLNIQKEVAQNDFTSSQTNITMDGLVPPEYTFLSDKYFGED